MPEPGVAGRPSDAEIAQIAAALPAQPLHVGVVLAGDREPRGWWGGGRPAAWADAKPPLLRLIRSSMTSTPLLRRRP
jgi:phenylalanyl-tRNA synthetase beta chain